jgi:glycosyltransferase involved in cell wall biosynthesis
MRVCFISHSSNCGGAEQVLLEHLDVLREAGVECRVVLPGRGALADELKRMNIRFAIVSFPVWVSRDRLSSWGRAKAAFSIVANAVLVAWHIVRWNCGVVYSNTVTVCVGALAARLTARPHIWHFQEFGKRDHGLSFIFGDRFSIKWLDRLSTRCLCLSNSLASQYAQWVEPSKIAVVYPSMHRTLEARDASPTPGTPGRFRCVIVGALQEGKGQEESILAMAALEASGVDAELVIYGDGLAGYRNRLEAAIAVHRLQGKVTLAGRVPASLPVMKNADAILICSRSEGFGRVTVEGMFSGKPVVGARSGATAELIKDGINGLLYDPGNPQDLADKIVYLRNHPAVAVQLGSNAQSWVRSYFTRERCGQELLAVLESLSTDPSKAMGAVPVA